MLLGAAVIWTLFVWGTRIRNALGDDALGGSSLAGVLLLSASFLLGSATVAVLAVAGRRRAHRDEAPPGRALTLAVLGMAVWTTVVWASRITAIVADGGHDAPFVAVHAGIGAASILLWWVTVSAILERHSEEIPSMG